MEPIHLKVGCTKFPNIEQGQIGFAGRKEDKVCMEPRYSYQNGRANGFIHIRNEDELLDLVKQIGIMTKNQFMKHYQISKSIPWKNDYIRYLDKEIEKALTETGIYLTIDRTKVKFYTEQGYYKYTDIKPSKRFKELFGEEL